MSPIRKFKTERNSKVKKPVKRIENSKGVEVIISSETGPIGYQ